MNSISQKPIVYLAASAKPNYLREAPDLATVMRNPAPKRKQSVAKPPMAKKKKAVTDFSAALDAFVKSQVPLNPSQQSF